MTCTPGVPRRILRRRGPRVGGVRQCVRCAEASPAHRMSRTTCAAARHPSIRAICLFAASLVLASDGLRAESSVAVLAGTTRGGLLNAERLTWKAAVSVWATNNIGTEVAFSRVENALEVEGQPDLVVKSSITLLGLNLRAAPLGHQGHVRPVLLGGLGWMRSSLQTRFSNAPRRSSGLSIEAGAAIVGDLTRAWGWHLETRYTRDVTDQVSAPGLSIPGWSYWTIAGGMAFTVRP